MDLPKCQKCNNGLLIPLSDYGQEGASVMYKAWACTNPDCGFSIRIDKGEVTYGKESSRSTDTPIVKSKLLSNRDILLQDSNIPPQAGML